MMEENSQQATPVSLGMLHEQMTWLTGQQAALRAENTRLKEELALTHAEFAEFTRELGATRQETTHAGKNEVKGADPPVFTGSQKDLEGWITACRLRFAGQPSKFDNEEKKVVFASTFMRGPPMSWFQPVINTVTMKGTGTPPPEFQSFETFVQSLRALYGDPNLQ